MTEVGSGTFVSGIFVPGLFVGIFARKSVLVKVCSIDKKWLGYGN